MKKAKRLKKIAAGVLALSLILPMMAGCKNSVGSKSATASADTSVKTKITVWAANRQDIDYVQSAIADYNKTNPNGVEIDYSVYTDNYVQALQLAYSTDAAPDLMCDSGTFFITYVNKGYFLPLNKYLTSSYKARFGDDAFLKGINVINGKIYSLPAIVTTPRLIVNEDVFKQAGISSYPASMTDLVNDANIISSKLKSQGVYGFAGNLKSPSQFVARTLVQILELSGNPIREGYNLKTAKYDFTPYKPILKAFNQIFTSDAAFPGCEALDIDPLRAQFANGKIGMYISWSHGEPGVYKNQFPTKVNWTMASLPTIDGKVKSTQDINLADRWFYVNGHTKNPEKAFKALQFFYSDNYLKGYYENGLSIVNVPSVLKVAKTPDVVQRMPLVQMTKSDAVWPNIPTGVTPEGTDYYTTFVKLILTKNETDAQYDSTLKDLNTRYNNGLQDAVSNGQTEKIQYKDFDPAAPTKVLK